MKKIVCPIVLSFALLGFLSAQETNASGIQQMTLQQAINYALEQSMTIRNAQITIADAEQQIIERRSIGLPQLSGNVSYQRYTQVPVQPLPDDFNIFGIFGQALAVDLRPYLSEDTQAAVDGAFGNANGGDSGGGVSFFLKNNFTASLNLDAMIFDGSYFIGLRAAREYRKYTLKEFATKQREVRNQAIESYLPVMLLQENLQLLDKNITNLEQLLFETRELYKAGFAEQLDMDRLELSLANLKVEKENLNRQKEVAIGGLKLAIGYPVNEPLLVADSLNRILAELPEDALIKNIDYSRRPEFVLLEQAMVMNDLNVKLNKSGYLPTLRGFATYQQQYQGDDFSSGFWAPTSFVGLSLNVPIFDGLQKKAKIQRAQLDREVVGNQIAELRRGIELEVGNARVNYTNAYERFNSQLKNLDLAERIFNTTQIKYREGIGSSLEVSQAEQALYNTQSNYLQALYELLLAKERLLIALGE